MGKMIALLLVVTLTANTLSTESAMASIGTPSNQAQPRESGYAPVRGISMYYEEHGPEEGIPLVLIHGGGSTIQVTFGRLLPLLAGSRRIIALEEQGHGRTSDRDAPFSFESSADDVAELLRYLRIEKADIFGFSNGASIGLQMAIRHPELVRKLVFASSMTKRDGAQPQLWNSWRRRTSRACLSH